MNSTQVSPSEMLATLILPNASPKDMTNAKTMTE